MRKQAYYFSHDSNARQDDKIIALRMKHGWEGYGLYWALIEKLRDSTDYMCVKDYNIIAFDLRVDASKIKSIIEDFGLFKFEEKKFFSPSLISRMEIKEEFIDKKTIAGIKGNLIKYNHASKQELNSMTDNELIALNQQVKELKELKLSHSDRTAIAHLSHSDRTPIAIKEKESKVNENKKKVNKYLFVSIENLNESIRSFDGNKTYLFLAYKFWELWKAEYSDHKHLLKADVNEWVNTIRLIIEVDKCTVDRLIAILEYFRKCHEKDSRVRDFWFRTVKSIKGLRNHDKNGVRYIDTIAMEVNDFKEKDDDFYRLVKSKIKKLKDYESSQVFKEQI